LHKILVPIDGSNLSNDSLAFAIERSRMAGAEIAVVLVVNELVVAATTAIPYTYVDPAPLLATLDSDADSILDAAEAMVQKAGIRVTRYRLDGVPGTVLPAFARENEYDLIVMGTHGKGDFGLHELGSTAADVVRAASVPVFVVSIRTRRKSNAAALQQVLVAVDGSPAASSAVRFACQIASAENARVTLCTVTEHETQAKILLDSEIAVAASLGIRAETVTRTGGAAAHGIVSVASSIDADAIVMGTHGRAGFAHFVLGSVAEAVLAAADVPVCTVRHE
jgi:nucleotide-binding universal stress UspA family protein